MNELILYEKIQEYDNTQSDPLVWWKENCISFPLLSQYARKYLCIAATSVPSERVFSVSGNVVSAKRNHIKAENVNNEHNDVFSNEP